MSGLLVAYFTFREMELKRFNLIVYYVHRYIRLTIPLACVILFNVGILPLLARGPMADDLEAVSQLCRDNWWSNLLYINNFVNKEEMCLGVTWYLACDMQMYLLAPLLLYPMYMLSKKKHMGLGVWAFFMALFTAIPIGLSAKHELPPGYLM